VARLDFEDVDLDRFPCLRLALEAGRRGGTAPAALVGADETAVELFLSGRLKLSEISEVLETVLERHNYTADPPLEEALEVSLWASEEVLRLRGLPVPERKITRTSV
jgi:1-deoxy-D-xylulose-5-phosphate reductoisomerase